VDRSDKNKGWYWFYEDQSHGWVQVYFPEYGWIDFDTTVGNDEAEQSPTPDGTPPMQPPNAVMAANGKIVSVDTLKKTSILKIERYIFKDVEYNQVNKEKGLDLRVANIWKDSIKVNLQYLKPNTEVMIVSYAEKLKSFSTEKDAVSLLNKLPALLPIDEVFIKSDLDKTKKTTKDQEENEIKPLTYYLKHLAFILLTCILLLFTIPIIVYKWYKYKYQKAKNVKEKAYYTYKSATFLLNQLQVDRLDSTPFYFAKHKVDTQFNTDFTSFMIVYLKSKYANQVLNAQDETIIHQFFKPFEQKIKSHYKFTQRISRFLNLNQFVRFYHLSEPPKNN